MEDINYALDNEGNLVEQVPVNIADLTGNKAFFESQIVNITAELASVQASLDDVNARIAKASDLGITA